MPDSTGLGRARGGVSIPGRAPIGAAMALAACTCALVACVWGLASTTPALAAVKTESVVVFEGQLNGHQVRAVTLHPKAHNFRVTLEDGSKVNVAFAASEQQRLLGKARASGVTVKVTKVQQSSHKRRDIVIGVVVAVIVVALALGVWLYVRRRRMREQEYGPRTP